MIDKKTLIKNIPHALKSVKISGLGKKESGKVRDWYTKDNFRILIATDRISAFDKVLGLIPFRGAVLNKLSEFWFEKTRDIVPNHMIGIVDQNVMLVSECKALPVEIVVRAYITGVTGTSLWKLYSEGQRVIYGIKFPQGLRKNQKLKTPIITPTTKAEHGLHDERLTHEEILKKKLISPTVLKQMEKAALALYERGNKICNKRGLILVDTKYEFGEYKGKLVLIDEIHTPDSSRYWKAENYRQRFEKGMEPENFDKEFFRIWYTTHGYRGDGKPPEMPVDLQIKTAVRYIKIYEMITGKKFKPGKYPLEEGIRKALKK